MCNVTNHQEKANENYKEIALHICVEVPEKIKNRTIILFSNPTSGYVSKGSEKRISKSYLHSHVTTTLLKRAKIWIQLPINE